MNEELFANKSMIYHKCRPSYPTALIDHLYENVGFNKNSVVADIGSGTGIFSRLLLERGSRVFSIEPNDEMRLVAEKELGGKQGFVSTKATAEKTGLCENSVDFVIAAQAFHWFDAYGFRQECSRILRKSGKAVIVWNTRDFGHDIVKKDFAIRKKYSIGEAKGLSSANEPISNVRGFFLGYEVSELIFANDLLLKRGDYIGMNLSRSYSPTEEAEPKKYFALVAALGEIFDEFSTNGVLLYPHITRAYIGPVATA